MVISDVLEIQLCGYCQYRSPIMQHIGLYIGLLVVSFMNLFGILRQKRVRPVLLLLLEWYIYNLVWFHSFSLIVKLQPETYVNLISAAIHSRPSLGQGHCREHISSLMLDKSMPMSVLSDFTVPCDLHCLSVCHCSQVLSPALWMLLSCRVTLLKLKLWLELLLIKWMNCMKPCLKLLLKRFVNVPPVQCSTVLADCFYDF